MLLNITIYSKLNLHFQSCNCAMELILKLLYEREAEFSRKILFHNLNFEEYSAKVMFAFAVIYFTTRDIRIYCTLKCHSTVTMAFLQQLLSTYFSNIYNKIPEQLIIDSTTFNEPRLICQYL